MAWNQRGWGNSRNATSANFSARWTQSGGIRVWPLMTFAWWLMFTWALKIAPGLLEKSDTIKANARCFSVVSTITEWWHTKFGHVRYVYFRESLQKLWKSIANRRVEDWEASNGHTKDTTRLFHCPWHDAVAEHICAQPFRMWNRLRFHMFMQVSLIFQRRKSDANKQDFENKLNLICHAQSTPQTPSILTKVFCTSGPNFVVLAWTGDELSHALAQNGVNFDFEVKYDFEDQGQSPTKTIGILTKVFYIYGPNLVILAETGHELSQGLTHTYGHTHRQTQATTIPKGQNWPRVKMYDEKHNE